MELILVIASLRYFVWSLSLSLVRVFTFCSAAVLCIITCVFVSFRKRNKNDIVQNGMSEKIRRIIWTYFRLGIFFKLIFCFRSARNGEDKEIKQQNVKKRHQKSATKKNSACVYGKVYATTKFQNKGEKEKRSGLLNSAIANSTRPKQRQLIIKTAARKSDDTSSVSL